MLKWYDSSKAYQGVISKYKDLKIESELKTADKTLSVTLQENIDITNECYIRTDSDEYVVKEVSDATGAFKQIVCALNLEELEAKAYKTFSVTNQTIENAARTALTGTGWTVAGSDVTKRRNAGMMKKSALGVLQGLCTAFMCEMSFDTINKTVTFYAERGSDRGVYFRDGINLKKLTAKSSSYDFYTRIIPYGADDLDIKSVNSGVEYVENHQYSSKNRTYIWIDTNYTDATALKEDAIAKLADMSKPTVSYSADIRDLAKLSTVYSLFQYGLGDTVTLTDSTTGIRDKQRIVKLTEYPQTPEKNTAELSNTFLTWEEMQAKEREAAAIIDAVISPDGTYNGSVKVSDILHWNEALESGIESSDYLGNYIQVTDGRIELVEASVGTIEANYITAEQVAATYATIATLEADYATIQNLSAVSADVQGLNARVASIETAYISTARVNTLLADYTKTTDLVATYATIDNLTATNGNVTNLTTRVATIEGAYITTARVNTLLAEYTKTSALEAKYATITDLHTNYATISLSNVTTENVKNLLVSNGIIKSATIVDGHITGTLDAITVNGVNIIAGTVVADRLVIRGTTQSIVYALNNYGQISSQQTNTIDGYILTERTVNANRIVANSITASEIAANTITANEIAAGAVTAGKINVATISAISEDVGTIKAGDLRSFDYEYTNGAYSDSGMDISLNNKWIITPKFSVINGILRATDGIFSGAVYADAGTIGGWNLGSYQISQTDTMTEGVEADQYTIAVRGKNTDGTAATSNTLHFLVAKRHYTGSAYQDWSSVFYVNHVGKLYASDADIRGKITADSGSIGGFSVSSAANQGTTANGGHYYANSLYVHSSGTESSTSYEYESGLTANSSASGAAAFYVRRIASGAAWSTATARFYVLNNGYLLATTGKIGPWTLSETSIYKGGGYQSATAGSAYFGDSGLSVTDKFYVTAAGETYIKGTKIHLRNTSTDPSGISIEYPDGTAKLTMTASSENASITTSFPLTIYANSPDDVDYHGIGISSNYDIRIGGRKVILESETEITGNVTITVSSATSRALGVANSVGKVMLYMSNAGNMGIYDNTNSKYIIYKNSSGQTFMSFVASDEASTSSANMFIGSTGRVQKSNGSSKRYKKEIKPLSDWKSVLDIPVVSFKYRDGYLSKEDQRYGVTVPGFIAEEVDEHYSVAADRVEGKVYDWNARYIIPPMLAVEQDHEKRIRELEEEIRRLKGEAA